MPFYFYHLRFELYPSSSSSSVCRSSSGSSGITPADADADGIGGSEGGRKALRSGGRGRGRADGGIEYKHKGGFIEEIEKVDGLEARRDTHNKDKDKYKDKYEYTSQGPLGTEDIHSRHPALPSQHPVEVYIPDEKADIFNTRDWPAHAVASRAGEYKAGRRDSKEDREGNRGESSGLSVEEQGLGGIGRTTVVEAGSSLNETKDSRHNTLDGLRSAKRDWRFGRVRLESLDLAGSASRSDSDIHRGDWEDGKIGLNQGLEQGHKQAYKVREYNEQEVGERIQREKTAMARQMDRPGMGHRRGESSGLGAAPIRNSAPGAAVGGRSTINAGLSSTSGAVTGRVTKARFEGLEGKNTELGWGIVHLYRDGEESVGGAEVEVYNSAAAGGNARLGSRSGLGAASGGDAGSGHGRIDGAGTEGKGGNGEGSQKEDEEDYTTLCIPAVPSYLTPSDFLGFVGEKTREQVSHFRMVMTGRMNRYLVLMKFRDGATARKWKVEWDGKVFNSMEPETCHVIFIKSITFQNPTSASAQPTNTSFPELSHDPFTPSTSSTYLKPFPPPTPNLVELPTCPVCLERMDDTTGLLTIPCQHVFHCACLQKWRGSGCPVCRHTNPSPSPDPSNPPFGSGEASFCSVCDSTDDLWICLICGSVGCGRYKGGHAKEHWKESAHNFALEIETQHVWDYAGDLWVHRLIRSKGDGKVVELPGRNQLGVGGGGGGRGDDEDMDMVPREKLDGIGMEYTHLLTSQLESQRVYFEELVSKAVQKASAASAAASLASAQAQEATAQLAEVRLDNHRLREEVVSSLEKELARERKKAERSGEVARGFGKSLMEEKKVSEGLMGRIEHVNAGMKGIAEELGKLKEENRELREENRDLLFSITAGEKLKGMEGAGGEAGLEEGEVEGGTVVLPPAAAAEKGRRKGKGRK